jgi:hypothetical protein
MNADMDAMLSARIPDSGDALVAEAFDRVRGNVDFQVEEADIVLDGRLDSILDPISLP